MASHDQVAKSSFGTELWGKLQDVESYLATGIEHNLALNDFFKGYAQAELEYAAQLLKVAKPFREAIVKAKEKWQKSNDPSLVKQANLNHSSTVMIAWEKLLAQTESVAQLHFELSEAMNKERKDVKGNTVLLQAHTKHNFDKIKSSEVDLQKMIDATERNQHTYEKELKSLETCGMHLRKCQKEKKEREMEKSRLEFEKQIAAVTYSLINYKRSIETCNNAKKKHYDNTIPEILNEIQKEDEILRIDLSRATMARIADTVASTLPKEAQLWTNFADLARKIDANYDSHLVMSTFKTNDNRPVDFSYLDTHDDFKKKQLLYSENQFKLADTEDLASVPPKVGRKKVAERVKLIEKESSELEKKRNGLALILATLADLPHTENACAEVVIHKNDIELKIKSLALKRQRFVEYLGELDGKPMTPSLVTSPSSASESLFTTPKSLITSTHSITPAENSTIKVPENTSETKTDEKQLQVSIKSLSDDKNEKPASESQAIPMQDKDLFGIEDIKEMMNVGGEFGLESDASLPKLENTGDDPLTVVKPAMESPSTVVKPSTLLTTRLEAEKAVEFLMMASMEYNPLLAAGEGSLEKVGVLFDFDAAEGTDEMSVKTGTMLLVLNEDVGEGWSQCRLVDDPGVVGLVPKAYIGKS